MLSYIPLWLSNPIGTCRAPQPITQGTNPIHKEGIQDTIHTLERRFGPRSIATALAVAANPRA